MAQRQKGLDLRIGDAGLGWRRLGPPELGGRRRSRLEARQGFELARMLLLPASRNCEVRDQIVYVGLGRRWLRARFEFRRW